MHTHIHPHIRSHVQRERERERVGDQPTQLYLPGPHAECERHTHTRAGEIL